MDLKIYSSRLLDKDVTGYACQKNTCSHVCVIMPMDNQEKYKCLCPDGMKVDPNDKSQCICPDGQTTQTNGTCSIGIGQVKVFNIKLFQSPFLIVSRTAHPNSFRVTTNCACHKCGSVTETMIVEIIVTRRGATSTRSARVQECSGIATFPS